MRPLAATVDRCLTTSRCRELNVSATGDRTSRGWRTPELRKMRFLLSENQSVDGQAVSGTPYLEAQDLMFAIDCHLLWQLPDWMA
jgi:hypothetical protein